MTFEGFDAAPLIESGNFMPHLGASELASATLDVAPPIGGCGCSRGPGAAAEPAPMTLDAALREAARAERAAIRADALLLDLWVGRDGSGGYDILDLPSRGMASARAWAAIPNDGDQPAVPESGKEWTLRAASEGEKEEEIVVKGTKTKSVDDDGWWLPPSGDPPGGGGGGIGEGPGGTPEPPCSCGGMTPAEKAENDIDAEAAEILAEIKNQANQNMEYGSIIWRDSYGIMRHTPLMPSPNETAQFDFSALPRNADGTPDYSVVVGYVHSHPAFLPDPSGGIRLYYDWRNPDYLLTPSQTHLDSNGNLRGDWLVWDAFVANILHDGGDVSNLRQYVAGFDGLKLVLKEYNAFDRETSTSADGETIDPNTEACSC